MLICRIARSKEGLVLLELVRCEFRTLLFGELEIRSLTVASTSDLTDLPSSS